MLIQDDYLQTAIEAWAEVGPPLASLDALLTGYSDAAERCGTG
ncbi:hypothetical protein ACOZDE_15835 [Streptomyces griseoincarnatus]